MWLIDTAVQQEGIDLAHERPVWIVLLVLATGVVKLLPVLFGYLLVAPVGRVIPWILYALGGIGAGTLSVGYGILFTVPGIRYMMNGGVMTMYGWMRLLVWMPQFWVGGLLLILVTMVFLVHKPWRVDKGGH